MTQARRQTVFPAPRYDDAWAAIAFLELCFGFERQTVHEGPNGTVAHGELRFGTASFGLSSANGPRQLRQSLDFGTKRRLCSAAGRERRRCAPRPRQGCGSRDCHAVGRHGLRLASVLGLGRRPPFVVLRHLQPCAARRADAVRGPALSGATGQGSLARARVWLRARAHKQRFRQVGRMHGTSSRRQCPVVEFRAARRSPMEQRLARHTPRRARR